MSFGLPGIQVGKSAPGPRPSGRQRWLPAPSGWAPSRWTAPTRYWLEGRPAEGGRNVLVRCSTDGVITDVTPPGSNVRSRVHEYGGGAYAVADGTVYYANFKDQRVYRLVRDGSPEALTPGPDPEATASNPPPRWFFADFDVDRRRGQLVCVREDYTTSGEPQNTLVRIPLNGEESEGEVIASGHDFYSTPRISPDGEWLAWLAWRHPYMPWEAAELWVARIAPDGRLTGERRLAGGTAESVYQPGWSPGGVLYFVSDRDGWWKLYRLDRHDAPDVAPVPVTASAPRGAEFGRPQWVFGTATWVFSSETRLVVSYTRRGSWYLATLDLPAGTLSNPIADLSPHEWLAASGNDVLLVSGSSLRPDAVVRLRLDTGVIETLRTASDLQMDPASISVPEAVEFPTAKGRTAHAFFYAPRNRDFIAPPGERPPLVVISHGGPTAATGPTFDLEVQFWTTHGFAVVDVNYGGSSGYGREYRERLNGQWGVVDVEDCVNAAVPVGTGARRSPPALHPRWQCGWLHDAGGVDLSSARVRGGRELLRHQRHRGPRARFAQVRVAVSRNAGRARIPG